MKRILITGSNSYIGTSLARWLEDHPEDCRVSTLDMTDQSWQAHDFTAYDVVVHVAGIAHVPSASRNADAYFRVNRDLTVETAVKARSAFVKQFIFMSSIIVYGDGASRRGLIEKTTRPMPRDAYGRSKLEAEDGLLKLARDDFKIAIIRSPMVYGQGSKGNYPRLAAAARRLPVFPACDNRRSMLHIDNLCEFIRLLVANEDCGYFFPQNREHVRTSELVRLIAEAHGRRIRLVKGFGRLLKVLARRFELINKIFGDLAYDLTMSSYSTDYRIRNLRDSIMATEAPSERTS